MALTEEQKRRIEEEEAYRAKVREESQASKKRSRGCSGCLIALLLIFALIAGTIIDINPAKQFETAEKNSVLSALTPLPANVIGKHAYNKTSGAYRGEILEIKPCNTTPDLTCYVVNQPTFMRPIEAPVDNSIVKDDAPTPSEQP